MITAENISGILADLKVPTEFDLFSLDIDRNTYFIWRALKHLRPRVMVIEYNSTYPPPLEWTVEYRAEMVYNCTSYMGASLSAYEKLGAELGYALVGCETATDIHAASRIFPRAERAQVRNSALIQD